MIKKLLTRNTIPLQKFWIVASMLMLTLTSYSQTTFSETCRCLDNQNYEAGLNGQFSTTLDVSSASGETWTITTPVGIYMPSSTYPNPAVPIMDGQVIAETGASGVYTFNFVHIDSMAFSFTISNGVTTETYTSADAMFFSCRYARARISGEDFVCTSSTERYEVTNEQNATFSWSVSGGGAVSSTTNTSNVVEIDWGTTPGTYQVQVVATVPIPRCSETNTFTVVVEDIVSLACNNSVNLSMNNSCQLNVLPSMILEDMEYEDDSYTIELYDEAAEVIVPNGTLGDDYIGKQLRVTVTQKCGNNSCWGYVTIEDKSVVDIVCPADVVINCDQLTSVAITGFPVVNTTIPATVPVLQADGRYLLAGYDNCGDAYFSYSDESVITDCTSAASSIVTRTWVITDEAGNSKSCTQSISINRATLADVVYPPNFDSAFDQNIHQPSLQACGSDATAAAADAWIALTNGNPSPETTGYPIGTNCLGLDLTYVDVRTMICGDNSYKIQRTWSVAEECTGAVDSRVQLITVMDTNPPVIVAPEEFDFATDTHLCGGDITIPAPIFTYECSEWDYTVGYKVVDDSNNPYLNTIEDGVVRDPITQLYTINNINSVTDKVWIVYTATDECGNSSQAFTEITVVDDEQPIPVCDLYTFVALNDEGIAYAGIETFDDGSWDNCGVDYIRISRMTTNGCPQPAGGELLKFCCRDVGTTQMVQLTVYDMAGNSNSCMVEVEIQDNVAPIISCPADMTIDCSASLTDLSLYGTATATDICNATITETSSQLIDGCTKGSVTRVFTATDAAGNTSSCTQTITVSNLEPFTVNVNNPLDPTDDVVWPLDLSIDGCVSSNIDADNLDAQYGYPTTINKNCSSIAITYEDVVFQYVDGACYKVLRTWTVVDWCQYNPFTPGVGQWSYTQVIKILNNTVPVITKGCSSSDVVINSSSTCSSNVTLTAEGTDDCMMPETLSWSYTIDEGNDGSIQYTGVTNSTSRNLNFGTHKICWTVSDDCGNTDDCCSVFTLEDTKAPTPYCLDAIVSVLNPVDENVKIWASDFNNGASDNCDNPEDVRISFSSNVNDISKTFTCGDIANGIIDTFEVDIWFTDLAGNQDFCTSRFILQDNHDICTDVVTPSMRVAVAGAVFTEDDKMVTDVSMMLMDENIQSPQYQMTSLTGEYAFEDLNMYGDFMLEPTKDTEYMNGVSTLDLVIMQKHILGIKALDSPYKMLAADINSSESISAIDLIQLRKLILGIYDELPNNKSYRFVDANQVFDDVSEPFPFNENKELLDVDVDMADNDFIAVKVGDVNGSLTLNAQTVSSENRNDYSVTLKAEDQVFTDRETVVVDFKVSQDLMTPGFQVSLDLNDDKLELLGVESNILTITESNIAYQDNAFGNDKLLISWSEATAESIKKGDVVLTATFKALTAGSLSDQNTIAVLSSDVVNSELYTDTDNGYNIHNLNLVIGTSSTSLDEFTLYQNVPNPFDQSTIIGFEMLQDEDVTLRIFDTTGRAVYTQAGSYAKGYNEITIQTESIKQKGILYYQLETRTHIASKKMIVID